MALEDKDIFAAICARYPDQHMEFIMAQYALARKLNSEIEKESAANANIPVKDAEDAPAAQPEKESVKAVKKYTKRDIKIKPQEAIQDDVIYCCLCGAERKHLSEKHLSVHGISKDEYKKLCGYPPEQKLMAKNFLAKSREIIGIAQQKRMDKKNG